MPSTLLGNVLHGLWRSLRPKDDLSDGELLESFVARRDAGAFEVLLRQHGPMALGVCRRILRNEADAEDALQATFLVLVRKAARIRPRTMVGNWLYGVAQTTALKPRALRTNRSPKKRQSPPLTHPHT